MLFRVIHVIHSQNQNIIFSKDNIIHINYTTFNVTTWAKFGQMQDCGGRVSKLIDTLLNPKH